MGRVKDYYWDQISGEYAGCDDYGYEQELEILAIDAEQAAERLKRALKKREEHNERRC